MISIEWSAVAIRETLFCDLLRVEWWFRPVLLTNIPAELKQTGQLVTSPGRFPATPPEIRETGTTPNVTRDE